MPQERPRILLADADRAAGEMLAEHLTRVLHADVTHVETATEALRCDMAERYDLILAELQLPDTDALKLTRQLQAYGERPIILTTERPTLGRAVEAMRLGVKDMLTKPFDLGRLTDVARHALEQHEKTDRQHRTMRRLRKKCRRLTAEHRELNERVELICRDLVGAYGRLAKRVVEQHLDFD